MAFHEAPRVYLTPEESRARRKVKVGSKTHMTAQIIIGDGRGRRVMAESHLELSACLVLNAHPQTAEIVEQVPVEWHHADKLRTHYIDFVVIKVDRTRVGYAVRPCCRVTRSYFDELCQIKSQVCANGLLADFCLITEEDISPVALENARLLHSVRHPDPQPDIAAAEVVSALTGTKSLAELAQKTGDPGTGMRAMIRLIRSGHLRLVENTTIAPSSLVFKAKALS